MSETIREQNQAKSFVAKPPQGGRGVFSSLSFRARLVVLIFIIAIPSFGLALYGNFNERRIQTVRLRDQASALCDQAATREQNLIQNADHLLTTLTQFPFLLIGTNSAFSEANFANLRRLSPEYLNFGLVETNGMVFCSANPMTRSVYLGDRTYFQRALHNRRFAVGDFLVGRLTSEPGLNFGLPVTNSDGRIERVLFASLKVSRMSEVLQELHMPKGGTVSVLDSQGVIIARKPGSTDVTGTRFPDQRASEQIHSRESDCFEMRDPDGISRLYAVTALTERGDPGLFVVVDVPLTVLFARANKELAGSLAMLAFATFVIWIAVALYAKRYLLVPVRVLSKAARLLADGEMSARVGRLDGAGELVNLGKALDTMAERTQERTVALEQANSALRSEIEERKRAEQRIKEQEEEKKKIEAQFLRSQRMESLGALAGGIAHDLNNALVPVVIGADMLREGIKDNEDRNRLLDLIKDSGNRCRGMVRQIVNFARGAKGTQGQIPIRDLLTEMVGIIRNTFPKTINVTLHVEQGVSSVEGDGTELHQVLLNLCVNARDAMPLGGTLALSAENVTIAEPGIPANSGSHSGSFVKLTVRDSGGGIPADLQARIFEPFFTTKDPEKGTGLGLSTVATLVKKHRGFVELESEPGKGTAFKVYLPAHVQEPSATAEAQEPALPSGNGEVILFADDEQVVLELGKTTLENYGYRVLMARNGLEAIAIFEKSKDQIDLIITDKDMPFLDGVAALSKIQALAPGVPVILASASDEGPVAKKQNGVAISERLDKPYGVEQLLRAVARALAN